MALAVRLLAAEDGVVVNQKYPLLFSYPKIKILRGKLNVLTFTFKPVCVYINYLVTLRDTPAVYYYLNQNIMFYPIGYTSVYNKATTGKFRYNTVCIWGSNSITWYVDNTEVDHSDS